jgi:hypothetical protein
MLFVSVGEPFLTALFSMGWKKFTYVFWGK